MKKTELDLSQSTPDEGAIRALRFLAKSAFSSAPGLGVFGELFDLLVADPASTRRDRIITALAQGLGELLDQGVVTYDDLRGDGDASALFLQAVHAAVRSQGEEKLRALRNAALNGACCKADDRTRAFIVLGLVDRLTDLHIALLNFISNPHRKAPRTPEERLSAKMWGTLVSKHPVGSGGGSIRTVDDGGEYYFDKADFDTRELVVRDLGMLGLVVEKEGEAVGHRYRTNQATGERHSDQWATTTLGNLVLNYIRKPDLLAGE